MLIKVLRHACVLGVFLWLALQNANAQGSLGVANGRVTDPTGIAVAGADVLLTNVATAQTKQTKTNTKGYYSFPALQPNNYTVRVKMQGFKTTTSSFTLEVNQTLANDIALEVGSVETSVEVQAIAPLIQSETSATGQMITGQHASS
ncbi:MAG TPA: carboxypeptidase-like regulatory domain-containing protein [Edaphobacter sp.]|jgi:hypothetical protein|nr:carboxypeptidase-like regulatory domain-containing protein [Edaphobacter sp.]